MIDPIMLILAYLLSTAGAGAAASNLFNQLRDWWATKPAVGRFAPAFEQALNTRIGARLTVFALAAAISTVAAALLAYATGQPVGPTVQKALYAVVASQVYHLKDMIGQAPASVVFTPDAEAK